MEQEAARAHFDRWAGVYGRSRLLPALQARALEALRIVPGDRLLDVACGAGGLVIGVAPRVERAVGVDLSEGMLDLARAQLADAGPLPNVEFVQAPSDALPFEDGAFTAVVCTTAFHHFPDPQGSIAEMARVLAPGGRVVIGDASRDAPWTLVGDAFLRVVEDGHVGLKRRRALEALLERAGLRVTQSRHVWLHTYAVVAAEKPAR